MSGPAAPPAWLRRARPALGTLVELGVALPAGQEVAQARRRAEAVLAPAWRALDEVERALSAFQPGSDVARFNAAPAGAELTVGQHAAAVLRVAAAMGRASGGLFDVTLGSGPEGWSLDRPGGARAWRLRKLTAAVRLDLGGIAKGYAVDRAFHALRRAAGRGACWVNAGGDLRVHGVSLPVRLRDEAAGGAAPFLTLAEGALATSHYGPAARSRLAGAAPEAERHVVVVSPRCLWSDALTKVVALSGRADHPLLSRHGATAWLRA